MATDLHRNYAAVSISTRELDRSGNEPLPSCTDEAIESDQISVKNLLQLKSQERKKNIGVDGV